MTPGFTLRRAGRSWWWIYGLCASAVLAALAFISRTALDLERATFAATARARVQDSVRLALWRMDSLLLPLVAREGARPYFEYLPYFPQERSYTRLLNEIEKGDVLCPSPLLNATPEHVRAHFQVDASGSFTSPQVPGGNLRDLAEATCLPFGAVVRATTLLDQVRQLVPLAEVRPRVAQIEACEDALSRHWLAPPPAPLAPLPAVQAVEGPPVDPVEYNARQKSAYKTKKEAQLDSNVKALGYVTANTGPTVDVGSLVPLWLGASNELFFFRRVKIGEQELLQGIWLDWPRLEQTLLAEVVELLPGARLEPLNAPAAAAPGAEPSSLATIPVRLVIPDALPGPSGATGFTAVHATLALAWGAVAAALVGGFFLLRSSIALGERRSRFASAVTHELRTPLTTFRMYSEMLADGMVSAPEQRSLYLSTLKEESARLATLVENVLAYARLEDGRGAARRESVTAGRLLERILPALERRASDGGMPFVTGLTLDPELPLATDVDAVGQVVLNLVDNSCKYARDAADRTITFTATRNGRAIELAVRDHGPGIPADAARRVFAPFDRGTRNGDPTPGVGLGLALARGIARDLAGELLLSPTEGTGACFVLRLPVQGAAS